MSAVGKSTELEAFSQRLLQNAESRIGKIDAATETAKRLHSVELTEAAIAHLENAQKRLTPAPDTYKRGIADLLRQYRE